MAFRFTPLAWPAPGKPKAQEAQAEIQEAEVDIFSPAAHRAEPEVHERRIEDFFDKLDAGTHYPLPGTRCEILTSLEAYEHALDACIERGLLCFDVETTGLVVHGGALVSIQFTSEVGMGYYVPVGHKNELANLEVGPVVEKFVAALKNPKVRKIGHGVGFDLQWFYLHAGPFDVPNIWDTMIAAHVIDENRPKYGLKALARTLLGIGMTTFQSLGVMKDPNRPHTGKYKDFSEVPASAGVPYACADVDVDLQLYLKFLPAIDQQYSQIFYKVEMPLVPVLSRMEFLGVEMDANYMHKLGDHLAREIDVLKGALISIVNAIDPTALTTVLDDLNQDRYYKRPGADGEVRKRANFLDDFNWESAPQLVKLFNILGINTGRVTPGSKKTGKLKMSTDKKALVSMARQASHQGHRIAKALLGWRQMTKIHSAFAVSLPTKINPITGRIHPSYHQERTVTARLSCSDPNLQQIPKSGVCAVRYPFKPKEGYVFLQNDFSQVELRILAHISGDESMLTAFRTGIDIHAQTAYECFVNEIPRGTPLKDIARKDSPYYKLRTAAKTITFGIVYGMGEKALAETLDIPVDKAKGYINSFLDAKPKVRMYMIDMVRFMERFGYVETPLGRRRHIPVGPDGRRPFGWERKAINFPIQSASAEIMKRVMARTTAAFDDAALPASVLLQIHDELIVECREDAVPQGLKIMKECFELGIEDLGYKYSVPLEADPAVQVRWAIDAVQCPACSRYGRIKNNVSKAFLCVHCDGVSDPGAWDIQETLQVIVDRAAIDEEAA